MADPSLSQALAEAYASCPEEVVILHTLELRHPAFRDELGRETAIRVVRDHADLIATLEASAPSNPGEQVLFVAFAFDFTLPEVSPNGSPEIAISLDNVSNEIVMNLELAVQTPDLIEVTYRPYLSTDLDGPHMDPPLHLTLFSVEVDLMRVSGRAGFVNFMNRPFPSEDYTAERFPGLIR